jgi:AmmeMemoRadiSam system protein B
MKARRADFAGNWYPSSASECEREIKFFLEEEQVKAHSSAKLIGGIVPHAGWYFSGPRYIMREGAWATPFGDLQVDDEIAGKLIEKFTFNIETSENCSSDNTIELQLPFIKYFFDDVRILPVGVPPSAESIDVGETVAEIATDLNRQIIVLGSTDLTHYGSNYGFVSKGTGPSALDWVRNENDRRIIDAILTMEPEKVISEALASQNACCAGAVATAMACAKQLGATRSESLAYASSYDKSPGDSFVGYVGIVFE